METPFAWQPEYSVGDAAIDGQHRKMIDILNQLAALLGAGDAADQAAAERIFDELAQYVTAHFAYEERRMVEAGYPADKVQAHRKIHDTLLLTLQQHQQRVSSGGREAIAELMPFLYGDWLIRHICQEDMAYAPYLQTPAAA